MSRGGQTGVGEGRQEQERADMSRGGHAADRSRRDTSRGGQAGVGKGRHEQGS